jgi:hypothetical protein
MSFANLRHFYHASSAVSTVSVGPLHRVLDREPEQFFVHQKLQIENLFVSQGWIRIRFDANATFVHKRHGAARMVQSAAKVK